MKTLEVIEVNKICKDSNLTMIKILNFIKDNKNN